MTFDFPSPMESVDNVLVKTINDVIHGMIELPYFCHLIIDTPEFQRLRFIKQLGPVCYVYPCAVHTRFDHSIGVCYMAGELAKKLQSEENSNITAVDVRCMEIAGLCHDLGQGPLSHVFKDFMAEQGKDWKPEEESTRILRHLITKNNLMGKLEEFGITEEKLDIICQLICSQTTERKGDKLIPAEKFYLRQIVKNIVNGIDVDTWDCVARDAHFLGIASAFEIERILSHVKICEVKRAGEDKARKELCFREKVANDINHMFVTRRHIFDAAYHHRVTIAISIMYKDAFRAAARHIKFYGANGKFNLTNCVEDEEAFCQATDGIVHVIMQSRSTEPGMMKAKHILHRIHCRQLYQFITEIPQANIKVKLRIEKQVRDERRESIVQHTVLR
ncbi:deoxynucleoside triphosphate triphosphohydrolase SAMHD1-like [Diadema setosum]|uniref:deoxynucleoside triphosphate triphosphohydrolase SAMHD1-like n=1 Tax=Diadema setosum TaxID=31175 RepID=UPI003B3A1589